MTINEYLDNIAMEDFDKYIEEDDKLWELYEQEDDEFFKYCEEKGIDLTATKIVLGQPIEELTLWVWDHDD